VIDERAGGFKVGEGKKGSEGVISGDSEWKKRVQSKVNNVFRKESNLHHRLVPRF
jgi:hypothetical protein